MVIFVKDWATHTTLLSLVTIVYIFQLGNNPDCSHQCREVYFAEYPHWSFKHITYFWTQLLLQNLLWAQSPAWVSILKWRCFSTEPNFIWSFCVSKMTKERAKVKIMIIKHCKHHKLYPIRLWLLMYKFFSFSNDIYFPFVHKIHTYYSFYGINSVERSHIINEYKQIIKNNWKIGIHSRKEAN